MDADEAIGRGLATPPNTEHPPSSPAPPPSTQLPSSTLMSPWSTLTRGPTQEASVVPHPDFYWQQDMADPVILRVDNTLYRVSKHTLVTQIGLFRDMFLLPVGTQNVHEGSSDDNPIFVPGVALETFNFILNVSIGRYNDRPRLESLISGLEYSLAWTIPTLRTYTIDHIDRINRQECIHPAILLSLARRHGIPQWVGPAVRYLQHTPLSTFQSKPEIMSMITIETYATIARLRERLHVERLHLALKAPEVYHTKN